MEVKLFLIRKKENDENEIAVMLMPNKDTGKYSFVNMSKGHICSCKFDTIEDAIADMEERKQKGLLFHYREAENFMFLTDIYPSSIVAKCDREYSIDLRSNPYYGVAIEKKSEMLMNQLKNIAEQNHIRSLLNGETTQ